MSADVVRKACSACGGEFECRSGQGCWCEKLPQVMPMNPDADCLCEPCLKKAIDVMMKS